MTTRSRVPLPKADAYYHPWMERRACNDVSPDLFFPEKAPGKQTTEQAKAICEGCPVRVQCLILAMAYEGDSVRQTRFGVWGGLTPDERYTLAMKLKKERKAA